MFFKKLKQEIERLRWKVQSLEEQNKDLRSDLEKSMRIARQHLLLVKKGEPISDQAIAEGLGFDAMEGKDLPSFLQRNPDTAILDVRTKNEFDLGYIAKAKHLPVDQVAFGYEEQGLTPETPVVVYCSSGSRSEVACEILSEKGFHRIWNLSDGIGSYPDALEIPPTNQPGSEMPLREERDLSPDEKEICGKVQQILQEEINPMIAAHGGVIELLDVREKDVFVKMGGGCQGCGMAAATLRQGVEETLRAAVPDMGSLYDVTDHAGGKNPYFGSGNF